MPNLEFGIIVTVVGMGTTFLTLVLLGFVIDFLKKLFPVPEAKPAAEKQPAAIKQTAGQT
jgi:Na+-transporting methylmalonyl-CoA/oxaloacetate decarboxylase gamma subunit